MPQSKQEYLSSVCAQVRWKQAHGAIRRELADHLEDQAAAFEAEGMGPEAAMERAVQEMGDPEEVGLGLDASYRPREVQGIALPLAILVLLGIICRVFVTHTPVDVKYLAAIALGGGCAVALYNLNLYRLARYAPAAMLGIFAAMVSAVLFFTRPYSSWIPFYGGYVYYYSCLLPALFAALIYNQRGRGMKGLLLCGAVAAAHCFVIFRGFYQHNLLGLVTSLLILLTIAILLGTFGGGKARQLITVYGGTGLAFLIIARAAPYRWQRVMAAVNPGIEPHGAGFIGSVVRQAVAGAQLIGPGVPVSSPYFDSSRYVAYENTLFNSSVTVRNNYLLTIILDRFGWLPALLVLCALACFLFLGFRRALRLSSALGRLLSCGIMAGFAAQVFAYALTNFGVVIGSPLPLPFISYGNTALVVNMAMAGLLLSLLRTDGLYTDTLPGGGKRLRVRVSWE